MTKIEYTKWWNFHSSVINHSKKFQYDILMIVIFFSFEKLLQIKENDEIRISNSLRD